LGGLLFSEPPKDHLSQILDLTERMFCI